MATRIPDDEKSNYETFRDCLSEPVLRDLAAPVENKGKKKKSRTRKSLKGYVDKVTENERVKVEAEDDLSSAAEDLGEFIDYLTHQIFPTLPLPLRTLHHSLRSSQHLQSTYTPPLSPKISTSIINVIPSPATDSLETYGLLPPHSDAVDQYNFFAPVLTSYVTSVTAPPPIWSATRTTECELCGRSWIPLTYHHLIPKSTHERVLKRKWHKEEALNSVAWLCRACHSFVHRLTSNEGLAKDYYNMELILSGGEDGERKQEIDAWVKWVGRVRWKSR
ncbi:hypothetical protein P280DRAFT_506863 [Massarina eburnea CBS 473.64]|uniref:HNH domain-containing protein n=1 Tax=Massarina eburnea CBS 473.64 TaxID=1395130 RepID=A0A6A6S534_9PLEO|nr:hypothetical protein P280DRAFT_506863 [Massarina eburnea CBS 473.64]